ncbi:MAG: T9SS type A sorting domain-containing protein [Crocinitomix sp.]|nr:T9SS type A sorting domain-containing protein [Crocinitomix sp.]
MKSLLTLLSLVTLLSAHSQAFMYVEDVLITPESPVSTSDEVYIQIIGNYSNPGSWIVEHTVTVDGFTVIGHIVEDEDGEIHADVLVPFDTTLALGMHSPGEYTVNITGDYLGVYVDDSTKFNFVVEGGTDGIDEANKAQIQLFPNPTTEFLTVKYENWQTNAQIQFMTIDSKLVLTREVTAKSTQIDLSSIENGIYFIQILDPKGAIVRIEQILIAH